MIPMICVFLAASLFLWVVKSFVEALTVIDQADDVFATGPVPYVPAADFELAVKEALDHGNGHDWTKEAQR